MPSASSAPAETPFLTNLSDECFPVPGPPGVQVMTDEQLEILRRQISVYATICQQLVEMHKASMAQQGTAISGSRFGQSSSCDSGLYSLGQKFASRQRWTPSQTQLKILEKLFQQGNGTPSKQRIKEISTDLSQYGQISETNVYNWFQNRRARTKRKQQVGALNNKDSEFDVEIDSLEENRVRGRKDATMECLNHLMNSEKGKHMEHQQLNAAQNESQLSQKQVVDENFATSLGEAEGVPRGADAAMLDIKPDPVSVAAISQGQGHMEMTNGNIMAMRM